MGHFRRAPKKVLNIVLLKVFQKRLVYHGIRNIKNSPSCRGQTCRGRGPDPALTSHAPCPDPASRDAGRHDPDRVGRHHGRDHVRSGRDQSRGGGRSGRDRGCETAT